MTDLDPLSILAATGAAESPHSYPGLGEIALVLTGIVFFLMLNAFFVASEFSIVKVRESQLQADETDASRRMKRKLETALSVVRHLDSYLSVTQIGITLASLALGFLGEPLVASLLAPTLKLTGWVSETVINVVSMVGAYAFFTFAHVVLGELVPKSVAIRYTYQTAIFTSTILHWFYVIFRSLGIVAAFNGTANFILRYILHINPDEVKNPVHSSDELALLVAESERSQEVTPTEAEISKNALELNEMCVKDILTPRSEVDVLDLDKTYEANWELAQRSRHTRFPLVRGNHLDDVKGWIHVKDLFKLVGQYHPDLMSICRELKVVPDSMPLDTLLSFFLKERSHFALVVDEFGDSLGLVFLDDVLEQIVGEDIQDEFDQEETQEFVQTAPGIYIVDGSISLFDLEDYLPGLELECPGVTTLGGYMTHELGHIPNVGEELNLGAYLARVTSSDGRRVTQISLTKNSQEEKDSVEDE